jgi:DNA topoisomerase-1
MEKEKMEAREALRKRQEDVLRRIRENGRQLTSREADEVLRQWEEMRLAAEERERYAWMDKYLSKKGNYNILYHPVHSKEYDYAEIGVDKKGRRIRKYDWDHHALRARQKFERVRALANKEGRVLEQVKEDMHDSDMNVRKNARAVYIIAKTGLRPGTRKEMLADQESKGVTTLKKGDVSVQGDKVRFTFVGKHGIKFDTKVRDPAMAHAVRDQKVESQNGELFQHTSDATLRNYLQKFGDVKTKDFRTLKATKMARQMKGAGLKKDTITEKVSAHLGNTPRVSESSYIDPKVWQ